MRERGMRERYMCGAERCRHSREEKHKDARERSFCALCPVGRAKRHAQPLLQACAHTFLTRLQLFQHSEGGMFQDFERAFMTVRPRSSLSLPALVAVLATGRPCDNSWISCTWLDTAGFG